MTLPQNNRTRSSTRANSTTGSSTSSGGSHHHASKKKPGNSGGETLAQIEESIYGNSGPRISNTPHPIYRPYLAPGIPGKPGHNLYLGSLVPDTTREGQHHNKHKFIFHYSPAEIDLDTSVAPSASITNALNQGGAQNIYATMSTVSFQFMIARQEEVATNSKLGHQIILRYGGGSQFKGIKATTFGEVGTLYDLEILFQTIDGASIHKAAPPGAPASAVPYIQYTPSFLTFGKSIQYYGAVTDLSINHIMFTPKMVPIITYVQISFNPISLNNLTVSQQSTKADLKHSGNKAKSHARSQGPPNPNA